MPTQDVRDMLTTINPLLERVALAVEPVDEGLQVRLVDMVGSLLNAYRLEGTLFDALDARSSALEAMYSAFTDQVWSHMSLKESVGIDGVGSHVTLLTDVASATELNTVWDGLEVALVSEVLQDVAAGTDAVLTWPGSLEQGDKDSEQLRRFWNDLSFRSWDHGLWVTDTAGQSFYDPAEKL